MNVKMESMTVTNEQAIAINELLKAIKSLRGLSEDGFKAMIKNSINYGKIAKNVDEEIKVCIEKLREGEITTLQEEYNTILKKKESTPEELSEVETEKLGYFDGLVSKANETLLAYRNKLLQELVTVDFMYIGEEDYDKILVLEKNSETISPVGFTTLYELFVKE